MHSSVKFSGNKLEKGAVCRVSCCFALLVFFAVVAGPVAAHAKETVFLLHGMGRTSFSMILLKHRLEGGGYRVVSESYPSTKGSVSDHVSWLGSQLDERSRKADVKIHFVTHSLGGIVLRMYLEENNLPNLGRVVMLSPPNQGSEVADYLKDWRLYRMTMGPSGQELGTGARSTPNLLGPVDFELGVITGDASLNPLMSRLIPGPDDGKVAVKRAKVKGMKAFRVVNRSHAFIMNASEVADEVISFLETGSFTHEDRP